MNKEELLRNITTLKAKADNLKKLADEAVATAQQYSMQRLDILEEIKILLNRYQDLPKEE